MLFFYYTLLDTDDDKDQFSELYLKHRQDMYAVAYSILHNREDAEDADIISIQINGNDGIYFIDNHKYNHIIWDNGEYIIYFSSNIDKNKLIEIADSVQKVD
jgi:hypothetical protein